jgi:hypothetical protein
MAKAGSFNEKKSRVSHNNVVDYYYARSQFMSAAAEMGLNQQTFIFQDDSFFLDPEPHKMRL